ncbi:GNAT family N-acetyltransferase [Pseudodesulfovibrio sp.]|uniref:GNAT family N-acetyltransferase n=1 Tax=unclassified Pseudodesulfovibrio TaxID=2661612 RepID=UPI003AFF8FA7
MIIRQEKYTDIERIDAIIYAAFENHPQHAPGAEPTEHRIVRALRDDHALTLALLAETNGQCVGHIALSPATVGSDKDGWQLLGPVAVLPVNQNQGIGSALIREAIGQLRRQRAKGIVLVGDPALYTRFGFIHSPGLTWPGVPDQYVLALPFTNQQPTGTITSHPAFLAG